MKKLTIGEYNKCTKNAGDLKKSKSDLKLLWMQLHEDACKENQAFYRDPQTGERVSTEIRLKRLKKFCKSGCRHCPYGIRKKR